MRRLIWLGLGITIGVVIVVKGRDLLRRAPAGVQAGATRAVAGAGGRMSAFVDRARAAMAEREAELRDTLGLEETSDLPDTGARRAADR